jgi:hypothetical protein
MSKRSKCTPSRLGERDVFQGSLVKRTSWEGLLQIPAYQEITRLLRHIRRET